MTGEVLDFNLARKQGEAARGGLEADDIRDRLHANPRAFVEWLYSGRAYVSRNKARIGNAAGEPGSSLAIDLSTGLWHDHATAEGGDLISLYRAWRGYSGTSEFQLSLKEIAADFLGDPVEVTRSAWKPTPREEIEQKKAKLGTKPRDENVELGAPVADYKYYDTHGNIIASVVRFEPDGTRESKTFRPWCFKTIEGATKWSPGAPDLRPLYRLPDIATASTVVLCEGEGCADALTRIGIPATSAMQGAKAPIDKTDWTPLAGKTVIIWPDNDAPGLEYAKAASTRLISLGCTVRGITPPQGVPAKWDAADCVAEGKDAHALIASAQSVSAPEKKSRIRLMSLRQMESMPPLAWLIDNTITENGLSMIWGRSGSLKSFVALDMAMCIATGQDWHGKPVKKGRVIYVAAEGAFGLSRRAIGWRETRGRGLPEPDIQLVPHGLTMTSDDLVALIEAVEEAGQSPAFIVIDTMSRTFGGGNPNQPMDMNAYVAAVDKLREATRAHILIVHHAGEDEDRNEIGNKGLRNACDTVIFIKRNKDKVQLINEAPKGKQKDAEEFKAITLTPVKVAYQQNDTEHSTLILNLADGPASEEATSDPEQKLGKVEKQIIKALHDAGPSDPLGLTRLALVTKIDNRTITRSLANLTEKGLVIRADDGTENRKLWRLA